MRIHYDWRLARVIDSDGLVVDEMAWSSKRSARALADRLHDLQSGRMSPEAVSYTHLTLPTKRIV